MFVFQQNGEQQNHTESTKAFIIWHYYLEINAQLTVNTAQIFYKAKEKKKEQNDLSVAETIYFY